MRFLYSPSQTLAMLIRGFYLAALALTIVPGTSLCQTGLNPGEHNIVVNGVRLWYEVAGQEAAGEAPVVYLHGGPGYNSYSFKKTIGSQLEKHALIVYFDERGAGHSERPWTRAYDMPTLVQDVEALRQSLQVATISIIGHSFGGTIALEYAAHYPEHVQKLIVLDGAADLPKVFDLWRTEIEQRYPREWRNALSTEKGKAYLQAVSGHDSCAISKAELAAETEVLHKVDGQAFHNWQQFHDQRYQQEQSAIDAASGLRNTGEIGSVYFGPDSQFPCYEFTAYDRLSMPVLIIVGKYDNAVGVEQMRNLADRLPHAHFDEFEQSAHFVYAEEPEKFANDVAGFLSRPNGV